MVCLGVLAGCTLQVLAHSSGLSIAIPDAEYPIDWYIRFQYSQSELLISLAWRWRFFHRIVLK